MLGPCGPAGRPLTDLPFINPIQMRPCSEFILVNFRDTLQPSAPSPTEQANILMGQPLPLCPRWPHHTAPPATAPPGGASHTAALHPQAWRWLLLGLCAPPCTPICQDLPAPPHSTITSWRHPGHPVRHCSRPPWHSTALKGTDRRCLHPLCLLTRLQPPKPELVSGSRLCPACLWRLPAPGRPGSCRGVGGSLRGQGSPRLLSD